jgi:Ca2+/Na+ antiporter
MGDFFVFSDSKKNISAFSLLAFLWLGFTFVISYFVWMRSSKIINDSMLYENTQTLYTLNNEIQKKLSEGSPLQYAEEINEILQRYKDINPAIKEINVFSNQDKTILYSTNYEKIKDKNNPLKGAERASPDWISKNRQAFSDAKLMPYWDIKEDKLIVENNKNSNQAIQYFGRPILDPLNELIGGVVLTVHQNNYKNLISQTQKYIFIFFFSAIIIVFFFLGLIKNIKALKNNLTHKIIGNPEDIIPPFLPEELLALNKQEALKLCFDKISKNKLAPIIKAFEASSHKDLDIAKEKYDFIVNVMEFSLQKKIQAEAPINDNKKPRAFFIISKIILSFFIIAILFAGISLCRVKIENNLFFSVENKSRVIANLISANLNYVFSNSLNFENIKDYEKYFLNIKKFNPKL